jgi:DegV family protein with EDD domain
LSPEIAERYNIPVIPQIINFGDQSYYEGTQMDIDTFMQRLKASNQLPKTAAPPPELFAEQFRRLVPTGETILCIHPSAEVSGTVRSATVAAQDFPGADIRIIDTRVIASPLGSMVEIAANMAAGGQNAAAIVEHLANLIQRCRVYFLVDTLEYLARGGRIGGASALLGSMLQIKPILTLKNGQVDQYERERTQKRAVARLKEMVAEQAAPNGEAYLTVMHAGVLDDGKALARDLEKRIGQDHVRVFDVPPAIATHAGPGVLGVGFFVQK